MLKEIKEKNYHYFVDEQNNRQGECKTWYKNDQPHIHCFYENGNLHGEYKYWRRDGQLATHCFYSHDDNITNQVNALVKDSYNITEEEKFLIKLNFGIPLC